MFDTDFNNDGKWNYQDWADYQAVYSEAIVCDTCDSIDVNNDGSLFDPLDIEAFYKEWARVPQNESGWTPIEIDPQAVCLFVDPVNGDNTNSGLKMDKPLKEADVATVYYRVGNPSASEYHSGRIERVAVLAFARGSSHPRLSLEFGGLQGNNGRVVITSYGDASLPRPVVRGISISAECRGNVWLIDLDIQGPGNGTPGTGVLLQGGQDNIRIEGCNIQGWQNGIGNTHPVTHWTVYRNTILDQWCDKAIGHSQGFGPSQVRYADVSENVFDRNGWAGRADQRTKFNHSVYGVSNSRDMDFKRNLVARSSNTGLQLRAWGMNAIDNVFIKNPANLTFGHDSTNPSVVPDGKATGNIIIGTVRNEPWMAGSALGINVCKGLEVENTTIVGLPGEVAPQIRIEPTPSSWGTNVSSFTVSNTEALNFGGIASYRSLSVDEHIEAVVSKQSLEELAHIDWDAFIENARQSRKGDWRWKGTVK